MPALPALVAGFLKRKHPPIAGFVDRILAEHGPATAPDDLARAEQRIVKECADILVYNRWPDVYDATEYARVDYVKILGSRIDVRDVTLIDAASGTGEVALALAPLARTVFAVEPVGRLRGYIREKAAARGLDNIFVIDGFLHEIPLPRSFADVLVASQAIGWAPEEELVEFDRVVRPGGTVAVINVACKRPILEPAGYREEHIEGFESLILFSKTVRATGSTDLSRVPGGVPRALLLPDSELLPVLPAEAGAPPRGEAPGGDPRPDRAPFAGGPLPQAEGEQPSRRRL